MTDLPGLDLERLATWFDDTCPGEVGGPLTGRLIAGGRSNLTYEVSDGNRSWVVRRPPLGHVLASLTSPRIAIAVAGVLLLATPLFLLFLPRREHAPEPATAAAARVSTPG